MKNKYLGYESVDVNDVDYLFRGNYNFLAVVKELAGKDPMQIFTEFNNNEADPFIIKCVLEASLLEIDGNKVTDTKKSEVCEKLITEFGLQEAWILAQHMLSYSMIGSVKKSKLKDLETMRRVLGLSHSKTLKHQLLQWKYLVIFFGICVCTSISLTSLLFSLKMG